MYTSCCLSKSSYERVLRVTFCFTSAYGIRDREMWQEIPILFHAVHLDYLWFGHDWLTDSLCQRFVSRVTTFILYVVIVSVGIALCCGLDDRGSRVRFPAGAGNFSLHHRVQNGSEAPTASYPMGTGGFFPGGKAAGAWSWPLTSTKWRGHECVDQYLHSSNTPSWRGA
jgi:hypothetical protein